MMNEAESRVRARSGGAPSDGVPPDIGKRTLDYAVRAVRLFRSLQQHDDRAGWIVGKQFLRAATSVGANVAEARSGETRRDFAHKLQIAQKEARESLYWLHLMGQAGLAEPERLAALIDETDQLIAILTTTIRNTKRNAES